VLAILLAAATALVWGTADYCGGRASQRGNALGVTVVSQLFSVPVLAVCVLLMPGRLYAADFAWGAGAGVAGLLGIVLLYRGLATGAMAVVAPITAVTSALVPMGVGLLVERLPSALALGGAVCAVAAIGLVSLGSSGQVARASASVVGLALSSGAMFGVFFVLLSRVHDDSGMWPLTGVRLASVVLGLLLVAQRGASLRVPRALIVWTAAAGMGDVAANALFVLAAREGLLSVVGPIAALYPVSTVLLALVVDKERVRAVQMAGLGLAAAALVLTAV
jgi:drug/metabolite transporter (DMT)-like permease